MSSDGQHELGDSTPAATTADAPTTPRNTTDVDSAAGAPDAASATAAPTQADPAGTAPAQLRVPDASEADRAAPQEPLTEVSTGPIHAQDGISALGARVASFGRSLLRPPAEPGPRDVPGRWQGKREWIVPLGIIAVAAATRLIGLDHPHQLVFDETYYVKDAWSMAHLGYEGSWPADPNDKFASGNTDIFQTAGTRVVHPPLGKWLIALGMLAFGGDSSFGWRFSTAILGILTVLVTYLIARRMTGSVAWAGLAGLFVAVDGLSIVMSRVSLLDGILTFFVMLGVLFIVYDHRGTMARIVTSQDTLAGPLMWNRPWVIAAGLAFGAASAVKWSGFFVLAGFGIYLVAADAFARRRAGVRMWASGAIGRQAPATFVLFVPPALILYVLSWTGWMATSGGYSRDSDANPLIALLNYHRDSLSFHVGLTSGHTYASPAWQWPFLMRPTSMFWADTDNGVQAITGIPNPLLWWLGCAAAIALIGLFATLRDWRMAIVLVGLATVYLPWLAVPQRTIFQFYTVLMVPFLMLALVLLLQHIIGPPDPERAGEQRAWRIGIGVATVVIVLVSAFFLPIWTGMTVPYDFWRAHMWLPSWV